MLPGCSQSHSRSYRDYFSSSGKLPALPSPFQARAFLGAFSPGDPRNPDPSRGAGFGFGVKVCCHLKTPPLASRTVSVNGDWKKNGGGDFPSILRSLDTDYDLDNTLYACSENLSPKEQTVVLNQQGRWDRVLRVFEFFKAQEGYIPNVIHYNVVLRALGRARRWNELRRCWIEMAQKGILPRNDTYGILVDVYGKAGLFKEALLWIKHMRIRGIFPDEVTMNSVVKVLKDAGKYDRAIRFYKNWCIGKVDLDGLELDSMDDSFNGSSSSPVSFKHFLSTELFKIGGKLPVPGFGGSSDPEEGQMRKPRLTSTYNSLIDLYAKAGRVKEAADIFREMLKAGVAMDTITLNTLIFAYGTHGNLKEAESLIGKMKQRGISPDTQTYNTLLSLYANAGNTRAASRCYQKIRGAGLFPDAVTYRAIIQMFCHRKMVREVEAVIKDMEKSSGCVEVSCIPRIVKMYVDKGLLKKATELLNKCDFSSGRFPSKICAAIMDAYAEKGLWAEAETVFYSKTDLIGQRDILEYNVMIKAYGMAKLYDKAFSLFKGMRNHGIWPDACTYNSLIQMFSDGDLVHQARVLFAEMQGAGFTPHCLSFASLISSYARNGHLSSALLVCQEMVRIGLKPGKVVFEALIHGCATDGEPKEAFECMFGEHGVPVDRQVLTDLIVLCSKLGKLYEAKQLYQKLSNLEAEPDIVATNSMMSLYKELEMVREAEVIFNNLREKKSADKTSFELMMAIYMRRGMLREAIQIAEEMKQVGLLRDSNSYLMLMTCYWTHNKWRQCGKLLHEMIVKKVFPDKETLGFLCELLKKRRVPDEGVQQLKSSCKDGKPGAREAICATFFSVFGMQDLAIRFCETVLKGGAPKYSFVFNVAIYIYGLLKEPGKALNTFLKMQEKGIEPDLVTYIYLVRCYGRTGKVKGVNKIYLQVRKGQIEGHSSLFNHIIMAYRYARRPDLAKMVEQEMKCGFDSEECSRLKLKEEDGRELEDCKEDGLEFEEDEEGESESEDDEEGGSKIKTKKVLPDMKKR